MGGYHARPSRPAAPRHGQERQGRDGQGSRPASSTAPCRTGVKKDDAVYIFELVDKFAGYGFNKSHAAAYALVSYHTAYLKANYREEFLAASMTLDMGNTDKLAHVRRRGAQSGIAVLPPCVNASEVDFLAEPSKRGRQAGRHPLFARRPEEHRRRRPSRPSSPSAARKGRFKTLADFAARLNPKALNKRGIETLAAAGAFDALEANRALVHANVEGILALAQRRDANAALGHRRSVRRRRRRHRSLDLRPAQAWTPMERLQHEFDAVGFYLSGHPLDQYEQVLAKLGVKRYAEFEAMTERGAASGRLAGIVIAARERSSQKGNKFAFAMFSDTTGQFEAVIFSDTLAPARRSAGAGHAGAARRSRPSATATR